MQNHNFYIVDRKNRHRPIIVYARFSSSIKLFAWLQAVTYINWYKELQLDYIYVTDIENL